MIAELPDGTKLEFPDDTDPAIVKLAVKKYLKENPVQMRTPIDQAVEASRSPTDSMSAFDRFLAGVGRAGAETGRAVKQLTGQYSTGQYRQDKALDQPLLNTPSGSMGNFTGNLAMFGTPAALTRGVSMLPPLRGMEGAAEALFRPSTFSQGALAGGANSILQPKESFGDVPRDAFTSMLLGGGVAGVPQMLKGTSNPAIQRLAGEGVTPTVGQMAGGFPKRMEDALTSIPILGDVIKGAQTRAVESVNTAAWNRALKPIGQKLPDKLEGREAAAFTHEKLSDGYNKLLPQLSATVDNNFVSALNQIKADAQRLPAEKQKQLDAVLKLDLMDRFKLGTAVNGVRPKVADGEALKNAESKLGEFARQRMRSADPDDRDMGALVSEAQGALKDLILRSNPNKAPDLQKLNEGWANFLRVQRASLTQDGSFTPAQLGRAVKGLDPSRNKGKYARGDALMQELSDDASLVMGNVVPDSGTPLRAFAATGLTGAAGGAGYLVNPLTGVLAASAPFMYTPAGQRLMVQLAARRPALAQDLGNAIAKPMGYVTAPALSAKNQ